MRIHDQMRRKRRFAGTADPCEPGGLARARISRDLSLSLQNLDAETFTAYRYHHVYREGPRRRGW